MTNFDEYIRQGEPQKREKGYAWQTAIGLQAIDGLKPSDYLIETVKISRERLQSTKRNNLFGATINRK